MPLGGADGHWPRPQVHFDSLSEVKGHRTSKPGDRIRVTTFRKASVTFRTFINVVLNLHVKARDTAEKFTVV